ncbi:GNAT family N-acetyltransferase [Glaesserella parasuis]|uniref:GNAT family N-acetyltransferase n=2 Tax=Glaesserella parasuis TaxID=738 RepID=UPI00094F82FE|nr:GNAT family N-acetyltransferase [Glaesserella parasuis]MCT8760468.1 GNAT family N-acetyltransferase [Glaesserella parasuis]MCT8766594.1 GNAT family N-acetyltransferase [Glaesserella parasuis]MDG6261625.1 GNAT family N-acetyltransferase [Glaesserella parasuis]MDG6280389.1 GNAT family N-acetyltransferase [Glaesserella parasuis]MDG6307847.1 GNAT family N-acetyltransferase [Glaesserella parasuis]
MNNDRFNNKTVISIEELSIKRDTFSCGIAELDTYFRKYVSQDIKRGLAKCYVMIDKEQSKIVGYYTLSSLSIPFSDVPLERVKKEIPYPILPAALIGRLAIDTNYQNQGFGKILIADAIHKIRTNNLASAVLVVDAKNDDAIAFYEKLGFIKFQDIEGAYQRLFYPLTNIIK